VVHVASGREWRGGQRQVLYLTRGLIEAGVETVVVTGSGSPLAERLQDEGLPVHPVSWAMGLDPRVVGTLLPLLTPDTIVHAHDNHAHTLADAAVRLRRAHLVATRRVDFAIRHPARWLRTDRVIALSEPVRTRCLAAGIPAERIVVIPPAVALEAGRSARPELAPPTIGCIAALTPEKGVDVLIEAAAQVHEAHPGVRWRVFGDGPQRTALAKRITTLGLQGVVELAGHVRDPEHEVPGMALLVQPSRSEGFGSSVLDALAVAVPVVASMTGGLPEALAAGGGVLVPPGDAAALAGAIRALLDDPARRHALGAEGREAARHFAIPSMVARTLDVYRSLAMTHDTR
jgi:glycosyltransferase involved in cell wall biosynthesis